MADPPAAMLLVVCTANRCRSPLAGAALQAWARSGGLAWTVRTAGLQARRGEVTEPSVVTVLDEVGVHTEPQPVRRFDPAEAAVTDLVLTAERRHRARVLELVPALVGRVFTLLEFERLLVAAGDLPPGPRTPRDLAAVAEAARWRAGTGGAFDDLADPLGGPLEDFRRCLTDADRVAARIVAAALG